MKKLNLFFFAIFLMSTIACKHDINDNDCWECEACEDGYVNYVVDFYTTHKDYVLKPAVFETVTEQVLIREAHREGATFQTVSEQYLSKSGYKVNAISDFTSMHIVVDSEKDSIAELGCYYFYEEVAERQVAPEYRTVIRLRVVQEGTGAEIPQAIKPLQVKY